MIKKLNKKYIKELVKLNESSFKPLEKKLGDYSNEGVKEYFEFTFNKGELWGYFDNKKLVGCVGLVINKKFKFGEIEHLLVHPDFQGKGIAKKLMDFVEKYAKKQKIHGLRLNVRCKNNPAIKLYEKIGYNKHAYIMAKPLK